MTELSIPWDGEILGDSGPYTASEWSAIYDAMFLRGDSANRGVLKGYLNELEPTISGASTVDVDTGAGIVKGKLFRNTAAVTLTFPVPSISQRIDRIVLEADWAAQTVRIVKVDGVEGTGIPALQQSDGIVWQVPIASVTRTPAPTSEFTLTDQRLFCRFATRIGINNLKDVGLMEMRYRNGSPLDGFWDIDPAGGQQAIKDLVMWLGSEYTAQNVTLPGSLLGNGIPLFSVYVSGAPNTGVSGNAGSGVLNMTGHTMDGGAHSYSGVSWITFGDTY